MILKFFSFSSILLISIHIIQLFLFYALVWISFDCHVLIIQFIMFSCRFIVSHETAIIELFFIPTPYYQSLQQILSHCGNDFCKIDKNNYCTHKFNLYIAKMNFRCLQYKILVLFSLPLH